MKRFDQKPHSAQYIRAVQGSRSNVSKKQKPASFWGTGATTITINNFLNPFNMKRKNLLLAALVMIATSVGIVWAADHIDAPGVASTTSDITDYYAFQSPENNNNMVFVANLQGLLSPTATVDARFDENVMVEFNIDNNGDAVEDLVIQAVFKDGKVTAYGPVKPATTGLSSKIEASGPMTEATITAYGASPNIGSEGGIKVLGSAAPLNTWVESKRKM